MFYDSMLYVPCAFSNVHDNITCVTVDVKLLSRFTESTCLKWGFFKIGHPFRFSKMCTLTLSHGFSSSPPKVPHKLLFYHSNRPVAGGGDESTRSCWSSAPRKGVRKGREWL